MELIRGPYNLKSRHQDCVASVGSFDGVHLGHQAILRRLLDKSLEYNRPSVAITFEPLPREYFAQTSAPPRLMCLRDKLEIFASLGIDRCLCIPFNQRTAAQEASDFLSTVLIEGLDIRYLVIGDDFCFGKNRAGDSHYLASASRQYGFELENLPTHFVGMDRVSSTAIRALLYRGEMHTAYNLLGKHYSLTGRVCCGDQRGRTLGFPTANILLKKIRCPIRGVFAVAVTQANKKGFQEGVANIGIRPTFGGHKTMLEVHLLDFKDDIYGQRLRVNFLHKIRDEKKFESLTALKTQIEEDCRQTREFFHTQSLNLDAIQGNLSVPSTTET